MPIDFGTMLASLKAARDTADRFSDLPLKSSLLDLYDQILRAREEALVIQEELHAARRRVLELEDALSVKSSNPREGLNFELGVWWASETRTHSEFGPFCPKCLEDGARRLLKPNGRGSGQCMTCQQWFHAIFPGEVSSTPKPPTRDSWVRGTNY